jgi:hypothetical protein
MKWRFVNRWNIPLTIAFPQASGRTGLSYDYQFQWNIA